MTGTKAAKLFDPEPEWFWLRGDAGLWDEMRDRLRLLGSTEIKDKSRFSELLAIYFEEMVGAPPTKGEPPKYVKALDKGGMSSGMVSHEYWRTIAIPLLRLRWDAGKAPIADEEQWMNDHYADVRFGEV